MNLIRSVPAVFRFEWKRSLSLPRLAWWVFLTAFPPLLMTLVVLTAGPPPQEAKTDIAAVVIYILSPGVVCMLGVFLWATPAIASELEGRSWVYLAVRPHGATSVLIGKYCVAVAWALPAGLISAAASLLILAPDDFALLFWVQSRLVVLSCLSYAAVFTLIGVVFPRRTMAVGVFYALFFEVLLAMIPAVVNLLTIQYRLRCLLVRWMHWDARMADDRPVLLSYFGEESAAQHLIVLLGMTAAMLLAAAMLLRTRQFTSSSETDV